MRGGMFGIATRTTNDYDERCGDLGGELEQEPLTGGEV